MIIDYTEIPTANRGGTHQDLFEQFACDFLETIGYKIIQRPDRGPDGKKDAIVSETRKGISGETEIKWLVSCKHYAHSGASVKDTDEPDIVDRVISHSCNGFLGVYSTLPASSLNNKLYGAEGIIQHQIYDSTNIQKQILISPQRERLLISYFPNSYDKYREELSEALNKGSNPKTELSESDILSICKTAIIILEIDKIESAYFKDNWELPENPLNEIHRFADHSSQQVINRVLSLLHTVSEHTRFKTSSQIANSLYTLMLTFFPPPHEKKEIQIEDAQQCVHTGFNLTYDAFIYLNNFAIAEVGLSILKFVYREGKRRNISEITDYVLFYYSQIETTLERPGRDFSKAKEFVKIMKADIDTLDLAFPSLPSDIYELIKQGER